MKCLIHGPNIKLFAKALNALAKIGEDLYLVAQDDGLALRTTNSSRSAFMSYLFNPPFFSSYDPSSDQANDADSDAAKCKLSMKAILMAFRSLASLDKTVESCSITISSKLSKTKIELSCRYSVVKTYTLPFIECESIKATYSVTQSANRFTAQARVLSDVAQNFLTHQEEVTMYADDGKFTMKNFVENEDDCKKTVHTEMSMAPTEFEFYSISRKSNVTYCLKELRAFITFADAYSLPVSVCFDDGGNPIVFSIQSPETLEGVLVMATMDSEDEPDLANRSMNSTASRIPQTRRTTSPTNQVSTANTSVSNLRHRNGAASTMAMANSSFDVQDDSQVGSLGFNSRHHGAMTSQQKPDPCTRVLSSTASSMGPPLPEFSLSQVRQAPHNGGRGDTQSTQASLIFNSRRRISSGGVERRLASNVRHDVMDTSVDHVSETRELTQRSTVPLPSAFNRSPPNNDDDLIDGTPPAKRAKFFFRRCFDATFNPNNVHGAEKILAPDSDEES